MTRIAIIGRPAFGLAAVLREAGYETRTFEDSELERAVGEGFPLYILAPESGDDDPPIYHDFRARLGERRTSVVLALSPSAGELPESVIAGVNDILWLPAEREALLRVVQSLVVVPTRRESSTLARVRPAADRTGGHLIGRALNVSLNGLLLEIESSFEVGEALELEFFLPDDPEPISASGVVRRAAPRAQGFRPAYGVSFTRLPSADRERIAAFCEPEAKP